LKLESKRKVVPLEAKDWLRCSSLERMCPREEILASRLKVDRDDTIHPDLQLAFDLGHGMHWAFQNRIAPKLGIIRGKWRCLRCGVAVGGSPDESMWFGADYDKLVKTSVARPTACGNPTCAEAPRDEDTGDFEYVEQYFGNEVYRIGGHPDAFLEMEDGDGLGLGELKSCSERRFKEIKDCPDFGHVIQMQTYMWLTGLKWGMLLYWCKALFREPLVEHCVERDDETIEKIKEMIKDVWDGVETGYLPERICSSADCTRAEKCELSKPCFEYEEKVA